MPAVPPVKFTLGVVYMLLLLYLILDIFASSLSSHKKKSFRMGFVCLLTVWCADRAIFWMLSSFVLIENQMFELLLFWVPLPIQSATFSFLLLYYCKVIYMNEWETARSRLQFVYVLCNAIVLVVTVTWCCVTAYSGFAMVDQIWLVFQSAVFGVLAVGYGVATYFLTRTERASVKQLPIVHAPIVNITIILCFLSRSAVDLMEVAFYKNKFREQCCAITFDPDKDLEFTALGMYTIWEFIPTVLTMLFVANAAGKFAVANLLCTKTAQKRFVFDKDTGLYIDATMSPRGSSSPDSVMTSISDLILLPSSADDDIWMPGDTNWSTSLHRGSPNRPQESRKSSDTRYIEALVANHSSSDRRNDALSSFADK